MVNELVQASTFLAEILNNTLDVSKLEEGKIEFNKNYESIRNVIDIVLSITKSNADKKSIKLISNYGNNIPLLLEFDKSRLTQVVMNLVGNAVKFTPEKGKVTVRVCWRSKKENRLPTDIDDTYDDCGRTSATNLEEKKESGRNLVVYFDS